MAASDKLIPTALTLANNLKGTKYSSGGTYKLPGRNVSLNSNVYTDAVQYFASVYAKEVRIATTDATWDQKMIDGSNVTSVFTPNRNTHQINLGMLVAASEDEWNELQIAISQAFNTVYPFDIPLITLAYSPSSITAYNNLMGVFDNGAVTPAPLLGADLSPLGNFAQGTTYADAWNTIKVPYDASIGVETFFIAPIAQPAGATKFYYRYTGIRRWFGFNGYDSLP